MDCSDGGCRTAAVMFGVPGVGVLAAGELGGELHLLVETTGQVEGCRSCGVVAVAHGRREHLLRDAPFGHRPVVVMWRKRIFRCAEPACPVTTFSEDHPLAGHRAALTRRAITWAVDALEADAVPRPSTGSSRRPEDSDTATATSPTTGSECSWPRTANAPTAEADRRTRNHPQRRRALKSSEVGHSVRSR